MKPFFCLVLSCLLVVGGCWPAWAGSTGGCHCFRNRDYDPQNRFAADDYLLTTCLNSLTAVYFQFPKKDIVMAKMGGGTDGDDLLIGLYLSRLTGRPLNLLLSIRDNGGSWQDILSAAGAGKHQDDSVARALESGASPDRVSGLIIRRMLEEHYGLTGPTLDELSQQGFSGRELVTLAALARQTGASPGELAHTLRREKLSWSELANRYRLSPSQVGHAILGQGG